MTQLDFLHALEYELRIRGVAFSRQDLQEFIASAWPLIDDSPDMLLWACEFLDWQTARGVTSGAGTY